MSRSERVKRCNTLMELMKHAKSKRVLEIYGRQLERCASRLKQKEQSKEATA